MYYSNIILDGHVIREGVLDKQKYHGYDVIFESNPDDKPFTDYKIYMMKDGVVLVSSWLSKVDSNEVYLEYIGVDDSISKGAGFGSLLMPNIIDFCKKKGFSTLTLRMDYGMGCTANNRSDLIGSKLYKFYTKFGFEFSHTEDEVEDDDEKSLCAMTLKL